MASDGSSLGSAAERRRPSASPATPVTIRQAAANVHAWWNAVTSALGAGEPMSDTTAAIPSAAPTWRATELSAVAVAKWPPGAAATAAPLMFGEAMPAPRPSSTMPGNHWPRKSGVTPTRLIIQSTPAPHRRLPGTATTRTPKRAAMRLDGRRRHGDRRTGGEGKPRLQQRIAPYGREIQDVAQRVAEEARGPDERIALATLKSRIRNSCRSMSGSLRRPQRR